MHNPARQPGKAHTRSDNLVTFRPPFWEPVLNSAPAEPRDCANLGLGTLAMTQSNSSTRLTAGLALTGLLGAALVQADEPPTALLQNVEGAPAIFAAGDAHAQPVSNVAVGHRYALPLVVETHHADSATFALDNSVIEVAPDTSMRIVAPEQADGGVIQRVLERSGSSLFSVKRGTVERFQVETPFLVSVVKGTIFNVLVRDDGATVALQQGHLEVRSLDETRLVELAPGDVAFAGRDGVPQLLTAKPVGQNAAVSAHPTSDANAAATDTARDATPVATRAVDAAKTVVATVDDATGASDVAAGGLSTGLTDVTSGTVSSVAATAAPLVDGVAATTTSVVGTVTATVSTVTAPVVSAVTAPVSTVTAPAVSAVAPVTSAVAPVTSAVDSTLSALTGHGGRH